MKNTGINFKEYLGSEPAWSLSFRQSGELRAKPRRAAGARRGWFFKINSGIFLILLFFPFFASAQVVVNEIAWMGTENSANDEWIELKNTSSSTVDLSGWILQAQDGSPKIELSGSVESFGYFLLERQDDSSVPGIAADLIYTGALSNSGEVLILKDANGVEVDRVDGSNSWESVGGDNTTKKTAQKTENGWATATSTPKAQNNFDKTKRTEPQKEQKQDVKNGNALNNKQKENFSGNILIKANAGENIVAQVGQNIFFDASLSEGNISEFVWNMGDGNTKSGKSFLYSYSFPGRYLVTLFAKGDGIQSKDQIDVVVYPVGIYISEFFYQEEKSWVELYNSSDSFVDLSFYKIANEKNVFEIPEGTFIAPLSYLVFSEEALGFSILKSGTLMLLYPNGQPKDKVEYEFEKIGFSASRKNQDEFVLTKNKTPGFANVSVGSFFESEDPNKKEVLKDKAVPRSLVKEDEAHFVKVGGQKSFLVMPASAKLLPEVADQKPMKVNIQANLTSFFDASWFFYVVFAFLIVFFGAFFLGRKFK